MAPGLSPASGQVRAYLYPKASGCWEGAGNDWFELISRDLADASAADPSPPAIERAPDPNGRRTIPAPGAPRDAKAVLTALGLTGEAMNAQGGSSFASQASNPAAPRSTRASSPVT